MKNQLQVKSYDKGFLGIIKTDVEGISKKRWDTYQEYLFTEEFIQRIQKRDLLIDIWAKQKDLPFFARKVITGSQRGEIIKTIDGRNIISTDNSPAQWVYSKLLDSNFDISIENIRSMLEKQEIPISFIKINGSNRKSLGNDSVNKKGFKLCHIDPIGLTKKIDDLNSEDFQEHFKKFMKPGNMFLIPLEIGGIGELKQFIEVQRDCIQKKINITS